MFENFSYNQLEARLKECKTHLPIFQEWLDFTLDLYRNGIADENNVKTSISLVSHCERSIAVIETRMNPYHDELGRFCSAGDSIYANAKAMEKDYPINEKGKFGNKGKYSQVIYAEDHIQTAIDFFEKLTKGAMIDYPIKDKVKMAQLNDKTYVVLRIITSTPNSPAVEISHSASEKI